MHMIKKETRTRNYSLIETGELIPILVSIPDQYLFKNISNIEQAFQKISELSPQIEALAESAFIHHDSAAWREAQSLLYYWNYRDLMRIERVQTLVPLIEYALRKILLNVQSKNTPLYSLDCLNHFTPEKAVEELAEKVLSHRINHHPLLEKMEKEGLSPEDVRTFLESYYVNNSMFHLCLAALIFSVPLEKRTELANNFYDEMGAGDASVAHPLLFLKNFNPWGKPNAIYPTSEALSLVNAMIYATFLSGDYHYSMGGFGFIELSIPTQMRKILQGLKKSGLSNQDLEFWELHIITDEKHGKTWLSEMLSLIKTPQDAQSCLTGGMHLLNARASMYDGVQRQLLF